MLLGMKKILDTKTTQCLGSCVDSLREEERGLRERVILTRAHPSSDTGAG
jgi:hypothetical protein